MEPLSGYLRLAQKLVLQEGAHAEAYNFGPRDESACSVAELTKTVCEIWGDGAEWELEQQDHPHEANYLKLDISKASSKLGWSPLLNIKEALKLSVDWAKAHLSGTPARELIKMQIENYEARKVTQK
jgi:CDP-glucose 4,6-dehydratase